MAVRNRRDRHHPPAVEQAAAAGCYAKVRSRPIPFISGVCRPMTRSGDVS
jgi:hypothetical protein